MGDDRGKVARDCMAKNGSFHMKVWPSKKAGREMDIRIPVVNASRHKTGLFYCVCTRTTPPSLYL